MRSTKSTLNFPRPFTLQGYSDELPAGNYDVLVEEELLEGLSFTAYLKTATYIMVHFKGKFAGRTEMRLITKKDLEKALSDTPKLAPENHKMTRVEQARG